MTEDEESEGLADEPAVVSPDNISSSLLNWLYCCVFMSRLLEEEEAVLADCG